MDAKNLQVRGCFRTRSPGEHRERKNQQADKVEASHQYLIRNLIEVLVAIPVMFIPWSLSQQWFLFKFET
ncbi:hypothetical protein NC651_017205 [Populus alba x Populus x berolinensis]|nr:hypothetical protein NC651_017205 [Populus alba x Populus x berolinensis]